MKQNDSPEQANKIYEDSVEKSAKQWAEPVESWEETLPLLLRKVGAEIHTPAFRAFIRNEIASQKQKQIEEFVSMLEDLGNDPIKTDPDELPKTEVEVRCFQYGYKTAKDDMITKLRA